MASPKLRFKEFEADWFILPLKKLCKINQGLQIAIEDRFLENGENRFFYITNEFLRESAKKSYFIENPPISVRCKSDDILMTRTGNTGQVVTNVEGAFHNNFFKIDFDRRQVDKNFFVEFLRKNTTQHLILKYAGASTIPDLNHSDFYRIQMPITSIDEQTQIASFLSAVDEKINLLTQKYELLSQYKQGMMQKLFSQQIRFKADDGKEFGEWEEKFLKEFFPKIRNGFVGVATPYYVESGVKYLQGKNIKNGKIDATGLIYINNEFHQKKTNSILHTNDILMVQSGHVGECAVVTDEYKNGNCHALLVLTPKSSQIVNSEFVVYYFYSEFGKKKITLIKTGNTIEHILASDIKEVSMLFPCIEEQTKIANFLSAIDQKIEVVALQIEQAKQWKKGLLQQMFV
ncbi:MULTISPECIES: restriction endonuclease subunit S [unclassified Acinetobacter]|uniref:restriction endonuclease subunit S n=1 Tax=unclassified Acinetobacter TaxID=196816 RepID=UPI0015D179D0|nr:MULTISPECIES: restriction endonuclease subunit S [unclassified Acinetobacter]